MRTATRGMTVIELVIVMTLLGVISIVVVPRFNAYYDIQLHSATKQLAADLRYAQTRSIATRVRHGVSFNIATAEYTVYRGTPATPAPDAVNAGSPMQRRLEGVSISSAGFDGGASVEFNSLGVPYSSGGPELAATGVVVLSRSGVVDSVRVLPITGRIQF